MVIYHFCYDLTYFGLYPFHFASSPFWIILRHFIVGLFLLLVGMSLYYGYSKGVDSTKWFKQLRRLGLTALMITIATLIVMPHTWIYFGVIHFIFLAVLIGVFWVRYPLLSLWVGVGILLLYYATPFNWRWLFEFLQPLLMLPNITEDIVRFFPWFGVVLIGVFIGSRGLFGLRLPKMPTLEWMGRHALMLYLVHQPLLFSGFYGVIFLRGE